MSIRAKLYINLVLFVVLSMYLGYRELLMMHPDDIPFLNLNM